MRPEPTQLQLEVHTDAQAGTFLLLARAMPLRDGRMVEWTLEGKVTGKTVTLGKVQRR